ncbi:MAG: hypothetical protein ACFFCP_15115 [Promethearchaeota archaeon]
MQVQFEFAFTGLGLVIVLIPIIVYAGMRIRRQNPSLFRRYVALVVIVGVIVPMTFIVAINLPPTKEIELDIALDFRSNSTADETILQYHWDAPGIQTDVYGIHIAWRNGYGDYLSDGTGALYDLLENRGAHDFDMQWTEFEPFTNETWTLLLDFYVGTVLDGQVMLRGDNESMNVKNHKITSSQYSTLLIDGLDSLGIEGLEVYMNISLKMSAQALRSCFQVDSIDIQVSSDLQAAVNDIEFCVISG